MNTAGKFKAGLVQFCASENAEQNMAQVLDLIGAAAAEGAQYIQTPENTSLMTLRKEVLFAHAAPEGENIYLEQFCACAARHKIWLHIGSMAIPVEQGKLANRSFLITPMGEIVARYDKIHMFDVDLPGGESYRESKRFAAGGKAMIAALPWGQLGMSICYDLRFAALYRALAHGGARFLSVPSAFTQVTGEAHWHVLLRARAIETGCFVLAAAQGGRHEMGRATYGHSLIVNPWGEIIAEAQDGAGYICAEIDPGESEKARGKIPSMRHDADFELEHAAPSQPIAEPAL